jgi:hypothetical protein
MHWNGNGTFHLNHRYCVYATVRVTSCPCTCILYKKLRSFVCRVLCDTITPVFYMARKLLNFIVLNENSAVCRNCYAVLSHNSTVGLIWCRFCIGDPCSPATHFMLFIRGHQRLAFKNWTFVGNDRLNMSELSCPNLCLMCFLTIHFRGLLFGLSEEQSKGAITSACRFLLIKAGEYI